MATAANRPEHRKRTTLRLFSLRSSTFRYEPMKKIVATRRSITNAHSNRAAMRLAFGMGDSLFTEVVPQRAETFHLTARETRRGLISLDVSWPILLARTLFAARHPPSRAVDELKSHGRRDALAPAVPIAETDRSS